MSIRDDDFIQRLANADVLQLEVSNFPQSEVAGRPERTERVRRMKDIKRGARAGHFQRIILRGLSRWQSGPKWSVLKFDSND
ncbi:MAG: hypothetical protein KGJ84_07285 [Elusimicrobia bacterium]|nr:hypothetical protein [Elusimicrobiota bacterium]